ncbi:MAG: hypothetical protein MUE93_00500 [Ignavibacteriaceae bacterium]|jgi:hypothetical protein|nr:hypothetical protein [Ignavibacteriaceae bacterium]MCU0364142.1 hypothetical protein [Ignavibacteriaceae bacterium]MCU0405447.1 hypothetical protein [Ignavibacteriaceae bacterium]MCU0415304.1 hypothetical protein [Ignavibacteriaceae bacterium]
MKHILNARRLTFILFALLISSCTEETTEPTDENTLLYTSFEKNGMFSADGWKLPAQYESSTDVPAGGGNFSLVLSASNPPDTAYIKVPVKTQFNKFKLTIWAYSTGVTSGINGEVILSLVRNGSVNKALNISVDDIIWKSYTIQDTFSVASGDSFMVQLTAGVSQLFPGKTYFDLCRLYGID